VEDASDRVSQHAPVTSGTAETVETMSEEDGR
jgi:hypothetical protein